MGSMNRMKANRIAFDARASVRTKDENGFLHVAVSNITKETVNPYYGREIPGWQERGLDPERIYYGWRSGRELEKGASTFSGLPLLLDHHIEDAEAPQKEFRVGTVGTDARWEPPYVKASLVVTDAEAIRAIEDGSMRELSCAYRYDPLWDAGTFEGIPYDFVMTNIRGNHVALVEEGRAGADVVVADAKPREDTIKQLETLMKSIFRRFRGAKDSDPAVEQKEVDLAQAIIDLHKVDPNTGEIIDITEDEDKASAVKAAVDAIAGKVEPEELAALAEAMEAFVEPVGDEDPEPAKDEDAAEDEDEPAKDCGAKDEDPAEDDDLDTSEAVKYGEKEERDKLISEHMREAAKDCGFDADDPEVQKAFAEGVKYGERLEKKEPEKLDREHESEGAKEALDEEDVKEAMDAAIRRGASRGEARVVARFRTLSKAAEAVRPVLGPVDVFSFDSASDIYGAALRRMGVDVRRHPRSAWRSIFEVSRQQAAQASFAQDSSMRRDFSGAFAGLNRIKRG